MSEAAKTFEAGLAAGTMIRELRTENNKLLTNLLITRAVLKSILTTLEKPPTMMPNARKLIADTLADTIP